MPVLCDSLHKFSVIWHCSLYVIKASASRDVLNTMEENRLGNHNYVIGFNTIDANILCTEYPPATHLFLVFVLHFYVT